MQIPYKRRIAPDNPFFDEGNQQCIKSLHTVHADIDFIIESINSLQVEEFTCSVKGCQQTFKNPLQYNRHYDMVHRYQCQHCKRNFPSNFLLGLHAQENHDSYFQVQKDKGVAVFHCLLESCAKEFVSTEERQEHVVNLHKYPADFRFNTTKRKHLKYQDSEKNRGCHRKSTGKNTVNVLDRKTSIIMDVASGDNDLDVDIENEGKSSVNMDILSVDYLSKASNVEDETVMQENVQDLDKKYQLCNEHKMECNCNDTNLCSCQNITSTSSTPNEDMETDDAVKDFETKKEKKRHIPKSITFGRGAHRGFARTKYR